MASLLLLVSLFSPAKSTASEPLEQTNNLDANLDRRIVAVHQKLDEVQTQLSIDHPSTKIADPVAQWGDWGNWGDWYNY